MNKIYTYIIGILSLMITACTTKEAKLPKESVAFDTIPHIITQVRKCSKLYTAEYKLHKIITHNDDIKIKGKLLNNDYDITLPVGSRKVAIPVDATIKAYIDFEGFSERNIRRDGEKIEIILPDPHIQLTSTKINHGEIRKYVALLRSDFSDKELSEYERQGRDAIIKQIPDMGITEMARASAAKTIIPFLTSMGFKETDITVTFQKDLTKGDISKMIDPTTIIEGK